MLQIKATVKSFNEKVQPCAEDVLILDIYTYDYGDGSHTNNYLNATCLRNDGTVKDYRLTDLVFNPEYVESIFKKNKIEFKK